MSSKKTPPIQDSSMMNIEAFGAGNRMFSSASQEQDQSLLGSVLESLKKSQDRSVVNKLSIDSDP